MKFLREIFDQVYPHKKQRHPFEGSPYHNYDFKTPNDNYTVNFAHHNNGDTTGVSFSSDKGVIGKSGAEGKNSHRVFSTVHHIIKKHLADHPELKHVEFTGNKDKTEENKYQEGSRTKLYRHMVRHFTGVNPKKGHADKHFEDHEYDNIVTFKIHKKDFK